METTLKSLTGPIVLARTRAPDLDSVRKLNCWGSEIEDISIVRQMPNLEVCSVSVNDITTLKDFSYCANLQELYIRNNKVEHLTEICYLKDLEKLRILWLADNPCSSNNENYRMTVLRNLSHLQKLDNIVVQDEEVLAAKDQGVELTLPKVEEDDTSAIDEDNMANGDTAHSPEDKGDEDSVKSSETTGKDPVKGTELTGKDPVTLSWEETNRIREQLGLRPLPIEKISTPRSAPNSSTRARNCHVLQAVLILVKELDRDSLEIVDTAIKKRLDTL